MVDSTTTYRNGESCTTVFIAVSRGQASSEAREATRLAFEAVRSACGYAAHLDPEASRRVEVFASCLAPADVEPARSRSIRRRLAREADAVVGLVGDASYDCGREVAWAIELGIPTLLVYPCGSMPPVHVGGALPGACDVRSYGSCAELRSFVCAWMDFRRAQILAGAMRRSRPLAATEPLRGATLERWREAVPEERRRVSDAVLADDRQLDAVLADSHDFATTRSGVTLDIAQELGVEPVDRGRSLRDWHRRTEVPVLPEDARKGLQDAIDTWEWDGSTTRRAFELGLRKLRHDREVVTAGGLQRASSLGNRFAWKQLLDKDARLARLGKDAR
jgi:hypothetical protein